MKWGITDEQNNEILKFISENQYCGIIAPTGSGKSTRMIRAINELSGASIFVTQPTIPAAKSLYQEMTRQMGQGKIGYAAEGENRALRAVEGALASPLLKDNEIEGARYILLNISSGDKEVTMDEVSIITDFIQQEAGLAADLIWGNCTDDGLGEKISVTIIATGFQTREEREVEKSQVRKVSLLTPEHAPLVKPVHENTFIELKNEELNVPVLKSKEESQVDLFAGYFQSAPKIEEEKVEDANLIRHTLSDEVPFQQEIDPVEASFELEVRTEEIKIEAEPVAELAEEEIPELVFNPDENKTD
jgi:cell division protein FtsZ